MSKDFTYVIPARMESTRFPNKPLKILLGRPVIDWVYKNCLQSKFCKKVIIATDSDKIIKYCEKTNKNYVLTGDHNCASNRVAEASREIENDWIVEVQGDEPLLWAELMDPWLTECLRNLGQSNPDLFLSIAALDSDIADNPNFVKVVTDKKNKLLWVSRSRIPSNSKGTFDGKYFRHTGFHLWKKSSLLKFFNINPSKIEISEDTHAVRIVENNFYAQTIVLPETQAIDIPEDLTAAEMILKKLGNTNNRI